MFGRISAIAALLPAILAAQEGMSFHPYARADIGFARYIKVEVSSEAPEEFQSMEEDLKSTLEFSLAGGLTGPRKSVGFGIVFQRDASEGEMSDGSSIEVEDAQVSNISANLTSTLVGAQVLILHELSQRLLLRGEIGLAKATTEQEMDMDVVVSTAGMTIPASTKTTIEGEGVAFLTGVGLDVLLTQHIAVGAMLNLVSGKADPTSMDIKMEMLGQTRSQSAGDEAMDELGEQDISSFGLTGGVRILF